MSKFTCYSNEVKWADGRRFGCLRCLGFRPGPACPIPFRGSPPRPCRDLWNMILLFILLLICSLNVSVLHAEGPSVRGPRDHWGPSGGVVAESACWKCCGTIPWDRQCCPSAVQLGPTCASIYLSMPTPFGGIPAATQLRLGNGAGIGLCFRPLTKQAIITIILYTLVRVQDRNGPDGRSCL